MKATLLCIGMVTFLLVSCDKERSAAASPTAPAPSAEEGEAERAEKPVDPVAQFTRQFNKRMMELDANGDGLLTKDETLGQSQSRFDRMDSNGDGAADAGELEAFIEDMADGMFPADRDLGRGTGARGGNDRIGD